uniref:Uncharacterized protein n=1 Tax=Anopheles epiroticus TaxID=199890 RepID=A0A182PWJ3_9DIPT
MRTPDSPRNSEQTSNQQVYCLSCNTRVDKWIPATVHSRLGDIHYNVIFQGKHLKRHVNQIRSFLGNHQSTGSSNEAE